VSMIFAETNGGRLSSTGAACKEYTDSPHTVSTSY
jgi:hypothetical protein